MSRCVRDVTAEGNSHNAAVAQCINVWNNRKKELIQDSIDETQRILDGLKGGGGDGSRRRRRRRRRRRKPKDTST